MAITGISPAIQSAINHDVKLDGLKEGQQQKFYVNLSYDKTYIVNVGKQGQVSVNRDLSHLSTAGRIKNAVVDFFSRATTQGESALTTRASQIQAEVQAQVDFLPIKQLVSQALNAPSSEFKNDAQYLEPGINSDTATFKDVTAANKDRLGLGSLTEFEQSQIKQAFPSFITGKDAIFSTLTSQFKDEMFALADTGLAATDPNGFQEAQIKLTEKYEDLSKKANAEFNKQFLSQLESKQAKEVAKLTEENTVTNSHTRLSSKEMAAFAVADGEAKAIKERENADKPKKGVHFDDNPVSDTRTFIKGSRIKV